uniref:Cytochrome P450 CYP6CW4 n=1 Tax=Sogatella furcifera TaxID=113103 RepID=A0A1Q1NKZ9_SOGFU|nr:cytochrome P450 CYP6CW4 [Sogatella furcifera]
MIGILVTVAIGGLIIYLAHIYVLKSQNYWKDKGVPYIAISLTEFITNILLSDVNVSHSLLKVYKALEGHRFGGFFQIITPFLMVRDPELIGDILIKNFGNFQDRFPPINEELDLMSGSLVCMTGERWRSLRYKLMPTFTSRKLKKMFPEMVTCSNAIMEHLSTLPHGEAVQINDITFKYIISVIGRVAFGLQIDYDNSKEQINNVIFDMSRRFLKPSLFQVLKFYLRTIYPRFTVALGLKLTGSDMNEFFRSLVTDTIKHRQAEDITRSRSNRNLRERNDFLQLLMNLRSDNGSSTKEVPSNTRSKEEVASNTRSKKEVASNNSREQESMTRSADIEERLDADDQSLINQMENIANNGKTIKDIELTDHIMTSNTFVFISTGSDTTATILNFALYELAANLRVQDKLIEEIDTIFSNQDFTYEAIRDMKYMDNVFSETLRKYPTAANIMRSCTENYQIPGTDVVLEKGALVVVPVFGIHMDPKYYPEPERFIPERFDNEIPKNAYLAFGLGPRLCIARNLALMEMKVFLARFLMEYSVKLSSKTKLPLKFLPRTMMFEV